VRVALLAPMKPPDHPVPSGDRTFARLVTAALERAGHTVVLASRLRTWRDAPAGLDGLLAQAEGEARRIAALWRAQGPPDAVLTYHNYHKAPDLLGPRLAELFALPYAIVEASRAPRRASGPWARHFALAETALDRADAVGAVTRHDRAALDPRVPGKVTLLPPFIDTAPFDRPRGGGNGATLASAAMMREGRKADSVRLLAEAIAIVGGAVPAVRLRLAGDGAARPALEPLFAPGTLTGRLGEGELAALFAASDLFVWPAINEPFGFSFLEAQAAGLPVVGGAARGVIDVVRDGETGILVPPGDATALAEAVVTLLRAPERRARMAAAARAFAAANDLAAGARRLDSLLATAVRLAAAGRTADPARLAP